MKELASPVPKRSQGKAPQTTEKQDLTVNQGAQLFGSVDVPTAVIFKPNLFCVAEQWEMTLGMLLPFTAGLSCKYSKGNFK